MTLKNAEYGTIEKKINVTNRITGNIRGNYNKLFTDPIPGKIKKLIITLSNGLDEEMYELEENQDFGSIFKSKSCMFNVNGMDKTKPKFNKVLKCIKYNNKFFDIVSTILPSSIQCAVHFRAEPDWLWYMKTFCGFKSYEEALDRIVEKYIPHIQKYDNILFQTSHPGTIKHLNVDDNKITHISNEIKDKLLIENFGYTGREMRAIIDFIISVYHADHFIGWSNIEKTKGSTHSMAICYMRKLLGKSFVGLNHKNPDEIYIPT